MGKLSPNLIILRTAVVLGVALGAFDILAHDPGLSSLRIFPTNNSLYTVLTFARADIETLVILDSDEDGKVSAEEFSVAKPKILELANRSLTLSGTNGGVMTPFKRLEEPQVKVDDLNNVEFVAIYPTPTNLVKGESKLIMDLPLGHRQFVSLYNETNQLVASLLLSRQNQIFEFEPIPAATSTNGSPTKREAGLFFGLGIKHILIGYDHLLFLLGLVLLPIRWLDLLKIITSFTIAHSITLALAALKVVDLPLTFVEPAIALSIAYIGLENLWRKKNVGKRWMLTFALGLIHGFGFAAILAERGMGQSKSEIATRLVAFNLGVEAGQICVALMVLPVLFWAYKKPFYLQRIMPILSCLIVCMGLYWFFERIL